MVSLVECVTARFRLRPIKDTPNVKLQQAINDAEFWNLLKKQRVVKEADQNEIHRMDVKNIAGDEEEA